MGQPGWYRTFYKDTKNDEMCPRVIVPWKDYTENLVGHITKLVEKTVREKKNQGGDTGSIFKRERTGVICERACELQYGVEIIKREYGPSYKFDFADIEDLKIGVKGAEFGTYPLMKESEPNPQIVCALEEFVEGEDLKVKIFGIATPDVIKNNLSDKFVLDENAIKGSGKEAFVGGNKLVKVRDIIDLVNFARRFKESAIVTLNQTEYIGNFDTDESKLSFRDLATKRSLTNPKDKDMFVWVYRWFTSMTVKKLMFTKNWDETKALIEDWREMDYDLGPAVRGCSMDDEVQSGVAQIKDVSEMLKDKQKAKEVA